MTHYTVADAVSKAAIEIGITQRRPPTVLGSFDQDVVQMTALLVPVAEDLLSSEPYEETIGDGYWLADINGVKLKEPKADTDLILFDGRLVIDGLKYRFLAAKGLEYGEIMRDYSNRQNWLAVKANAKVLDLDAEEDREI